MSRTDETDDQVQPWPQPWRSLIDAAARADDPEPHLRPLVALLGFEGLSSITLADGESGERAAHLWFTAPASWRARYGDQGYAAVDPRVTLTAARLSPVLWNGEHASDSLHARRFMLEAARYGVRSGFAVSFRDSTRDRAVVAFDSSRGAWSATQREAVAARLGDLMLLAAAIHERVLRPRWLDARAAARTAQRVLTLREAECLEFAARGLTSADIGAKLGIAERTVNFHMRNLLPKLEAQNRGEAIAKALARGELDPAARRAAAQRSVYPVKRGTLSS